MYQTRTHKHSTLVLLCLMASLLGYSQDRHAQPPLPRQARQMAIEELNKTLQWIAPEYIEQYGFGAKDDLSRIQVGLPVYQQSFNTETLQAADGNTRLKDDAVLLPLLLDGRVRCFMYLMPDENGSWSIAGIGGANEAYNWSHFIISADKAQQADHLSLLHLLQNNADYLLHPESGNYENVSVHQLPGSDPELHSVDELYATALQIAREARAVSGDMSN